MQPKFTQKSFGYLCTRIFALALILAASTQLTSAQDLPGKVKKQQPIGNLRDQKQALMDLRNAPTSVGQAPIQNLPFSDDEILPDAGNPTSRAFCYNGAGPFQLNKQSLLNTTLTPIGAAVPFGFPGAAAWVTTTQKMYVIDQASPFALYIVDTLTGVRTFVANCTGLPQANFTGMTWDATTGTMYGASTSLSVSQIFTVNITTGVCTPIGAATTVAPGVIMLCASPTGQLFATDIVTDNFYSFDKTTGAATLVGPLGFNANFGQDGHFDPSDGQLHYACFNATAGQAQLRIVNTANGSSTLTGAYGGQVETLAIYPPPQAPCVGTPTPGNTLTTADPVCPAQTFTLTPQNGTPGSLVTYQWQSSLTNAPGSYVNIPGAIFGSHSTTQSVATWYRVQVTCSGNTAISNPVLVGIKAVDDCYCAPTYSFGCSLGDYIARVVVGTINNPTTCSPNPFYTFYNAIPAAQLFKGLSTTITVSLGPDTFGQHFGVWVDFNHDGAFNSTTEFVGVSPNVGANGTGSLTINVPLTAATGITRLRVRGGDDVPMNGGQACGPTNSAFGESEDYLVDIQTCIQGVVTGNPSNVTAECSGSASFTGSASGSALTYSWEQRINSNPATPWSTVVNGGTAPIFSGATTSTLTLSNIPSTYNGYNYRMVVVGPCTAVDFTTPAVLTMGPLVARTNISGATICTGTIQALTLTNATSPATQTFASGNVNIQIPDLVGPPASSAPVCDAGINHTIPVVLPGGSVISRIDVRLNISHSYASDLKIVLKNTTTNQVLNLFYHKSGAQTAGANFTNTVISSAGTTRFSAVPPPFTGTFRGDFEIGAGSYADASGSGPTAFPPTTQSWSTLWGGVNQGTGNWTIAINDCQEWAGDIGTLVNWSMDITYGAPAQGIWTQTSPVPPPNTMFTDPAATIAYTGTPINTIYVRPTVNTTYCVNYSTVNPTCASGPTCVTVNVTNPVTAVTVSPNPNPVCLGSTATFTAVTTPANAGPMTYRWQVSIDDGLSYNDVPGGTGQVLTLPNVTQLMNNYRYKVIVTASPCGTVTSAGFGLLTIKPLPVVTISATDLALTPGQTATITATSTPPANSATSYSWTYNGVTIPGANTSSIVVGIDQLGSYRATVTANNLCTASSNTLVIGSEASDKLWLYPNPTNGQFQVRLYFGGAITENRYVTVFNSNGQIVATKEVVLTNITEPYARIDFDLSKMAAGPYVVKVAHKRTGRVTSGIIIKQTN
ncbi:MAG: GEVED domain-containing protein [Chitinophagaceae bacterium]